MSDRRSFLRGLAALPLIGGSVALIGQPAAAAVPVTDELHARYLTWLAHEHRAAVREHRFRSTFRHALCNQHPDARERPLQYATRARDEGLDYMHWFPGASDVEQLVRATDPSTRAAVVLSAVGCPLI